VLVDKPIATTHAEAKKLEELARAKNVVLYAFQNRRWDADYLTLKQVIREGILGNISDFETQLSSSSLACVVHAGAPVVTRVFSLPAAMTGTARASESPGRQQPRLEQA
jgi:hypothetical protein